MTMGSEGRKSEEVPTSAALTRSPEPQGLVKGTDPSARMEKEHVLVRDLENIASELRTITAPRRWIGRLASFFVGLSITALFAGLVGQIHNGSGVPNAPLYWRVGFFVAAVLSGIFAVVLYAIDSGEAGSPVEVCQRVLRQMAVADLIADNPIQTPGSGPISRWFHKRGHKACPVDEHKS